ncbi:MAG: quinolinate synthase NadA [Candidatus Altiarchaeota archaeon]|nr:quinolinate synthase NadA [Candidatus Altiarchaeota archaeon]
MNLQEEILRLAKQKNATILAHNYQRSEIQDIADHVGDSLDLSQKASDTNADIILFCGVKFMAETAKILNPKKKVLVPDVSALCPLADQLKLDELVKVKRQNPGAKTVLYINTNAWEKVEADCICTSANADKIVQAMDSDTVIFGPDQNLAYYVSKKTDKRLIVAPPTGLCPTHHQMSMDDLLEAKEKHPNAKVVVHPECIPEVQEAADWVASTNGILRYCTESKTREFVIGTENGMLHRLQKENPAKLFYPLSETTICPNMKMNTLDKMLSALKNEKPEIIVPEPTLSGSRNAIQRMLDLSR